MRLMTWRALFISPYGQEMCDHYMAPIMVGRCSLSPGCPRVKRACLHGEH
jgi:hypothetical protein